MDINLIIKDKIMPMLSVHIMKKTLKITSSWMNYLTNTKKTQNIHKKGRQF